MSSKTARCRRRFGQRCPFLASFLPFIMGTRSTSMGAQIIISSYLNAGPPLPGSLDSFTGVAGRNVSIMVAANEAKSLKDSDYVIASDVGKFGTLEFEKSDEIIPLGYKAANAMAAQLEKYALSDAD